MYFNLLNLLALYMIISIVHLQLKFISAAYFHYSLLKLLAFQSMLCKPQIEVGKVEPILHGWQKHISLLKEKP